MIKPLLTALALSLAAASSAQAQTLSGCAHVIDGDTIEVAGVRVRLWRACTAPRERNRSAAPQPAPCAA
jgi:endonuclease YncB( thermonuclease family)